jgi:hypothetical protein
LSAAACSHGPVLGPDEARSREVVEGTVRQNNFTVDRGLKEYVEYLGLDFERILGSLPPEGEWVDGGAGDAYAQKDFLGSRDGSRVIPGRPRLTAITYEYPADQPRVLANGRFQVMAGRFFEDIPLAELPRADLITDVVGILNYTYSLDRSLQKYLDMLKPDGLIFVFIPPGITSVRTRSGVLLNLEAWVRTIPGLRVTHLQASRVYVDHAFVIQKDVDHVMVPALRLVDAARPYALHRRFIEE